MSRHGRTGPVMIMAAAMLTACASLRGTSHAPAPTPPAPAPAETTSALPETAAPPERAPSEPGNDSSPAVSSTATPPCIPPEIKAKPKPKPKTKPMRKASPPQLPTAPAVAETPVGGVVDAQVKPMPVSVMSILGKRVKGPNGEDLGRVVDVLADASGRVRIAIIDFGGFLGVGDRRIAVDWPLLRFNPDGGDTSLELSLSREKLQAAPEYKDNPRPQTLMEPSPAPPTAPAPPAAAPAPADSKK